MAIQNKNNESLYSYTHIDFDESGWVDDSKEKPHLFDLVYLHVVRPTGEKTIPGWWTGRHWYGYRVKQDEKVVRWRLNEVKE